LSALVTNLTSGYEAMGWSRRDAPKGP
jgi:hypothetical protein